MNNSSLVGYSLSCLKEDQSRLNYLSGDHGLMDYSRQGQGILGNAQSPYERLNTTYERFGSHGTTMTSLKPKNSRKSSKLWLKSESLKEKGLDHI